MREGYVSYLTTEITEKTPETVAEALQGTNREKWVEAMNREYRFLTKNSTWEVVDIPKGEKMLGTKWVFKKRITDTGEENYKARLVVQGFGQRKGVDYQETFSPVVKYNSIRYLLSLAAQKSLNITHLDVETAYLNAELDEEIYIKTPEMFQECAGGKALKLKRAIYGLKQGARAWNKKLDSELENLGLQRLKSEPYVYTNLENERTIIVAVYVDDLLIFWKKEEDEKRIKEALKKQFAMRDLGQAQEFLGIRLDADKKRKEIAIHQKPYIIRMLKKFRMDDCKPAKTPMESKKMDDGNGSTRLRR